MKKFYLLLAAIAGFSFSANAATRIVYAQNFESTTGVPSDWSAPTNQSWLSLGSDDYGKFITFAPGVQNDRSCYVFWGNDLIKTTGTTNYTLAFDFHATAWGNNHTSAEFAVASADEESTFSKSALNANYRSKNSNWLFDLTQLNADHGGNAASASGDQVFAINGDSTNTTALSSGTWYTVTLSVDTVARTVDYVMTTQTNPDEAVISGTYQVPEGVNMCASGIDFLSARYSAVTDFDNIQLSYETAGDYANVPTVTLTGINNHQRVYQIKFLDGETLHYTFNGEEKTVDYGDTDEGLFTFSNNPNYDPNNADQLVTDDCPSGELVAWTTSGEATSDKVTTEVDNDIVALPAVTTSITNVEDGYGKTYTITASNADVPLRPQLFIDYTFTPAEGGATQTGTDLGSGASITIPSKGTIEFTTKAFGYGATNSTVENNIEYQQSAEYNIAHMDDDAINAAGFTADGNVSNNYSNYGRYYGYNAEDSAKIVYNTIPQFTKKASAWTDSVIVGNVAFKTIPGVTAHIYKGLGLVVDGRKGDDGAGNWISNAMITVNGVNDDDIIMFSQTGNYGSTSLHPLVSSLDEYLASNVAPVTDVVTGAALKANGWGLYRISNCLHRIQIKSAQIDPTGIKNINTVEESVENANAPIYSITGMRISNLNAAPAGIYIQNGKKFIKK